MDDANLLTMNHITKTYPGLTALDDVSFALKAGEVHALIGENGAGKSTLMKILMGVVKKDCGEIFINGGRAEIKNPMDAARNGVAAVFQELSQITELTVAENVFLGREKDVSAGLLNRREMNRRTAQILERYQIRELAPDDVIAGLSTARRQLAEIVKAIAIQPRILILDEPTSALTEGEAEKLFHIIDRFKAMGIGMIYISHRMNELQRVADRVTVLRDGRCVGTREMKDVSLSEIVRMMVGRDVDLYEKRQAFARKEGQRPILRVENICKPGSFDGVSFDLYEGEILGVAGLVGSGRSELMNIVFGVDRDYTGDIYVAGKKVRIRSVQDAMRQGIAMVPESRHLQGLVLCHSIEDNISLPVLKHFSRVLLSRRKKRAFAQEMIARYNVKTESSKKLVNYLSGGNQQKVVIAKWLATNPRILIVDELTAGIDVHSKAEIHSLICSLTRQGVSVIMISSEMPELLAHSDRVIVMNGYRIIKVLEQADQQQIMSLIMEDNDKRYVQQQLGVK